jgi:hypothetical protein
MPIPLSRIEKARGRPQEGTCEGPPHPSTSDWVRQRFVCGHTARSYPMMQEVGTEVSLVGPDNGPELGIDANLTKEGWIFQILEETPATNNPPGQVHGATQAIGKNQLQLIRVHYPYAGYGLTRFHSSQPPHQYSGAADTWKMGLRVPLSRMGATGRPRTVAEFARIQAAVPRRPRILANSATIFGSSSLVRGRPVAPVANPVRLCAASRGAPGPRQPPVGQWRWDHVVPWSRTGKRIVDRLDPTLGTGLRNRFGDPDQGVALGWYLAAPSGRKEFWKNAIRGQLT